ncbi:ABC-type Fe3+-siderophore transport system, permease component [Opitutaceae bacterium TAV1]|nr:ABC-type Fe3+-siderophore transport system, permease component [Opitutaceae bacterium TAV1]
MTPPLAVRSESPAASSPDPAVFRRIFLVAGLVLVVALFLLSLRLGAVEISLSRIFDALLRTGEPLSGTERTVIWQIRLPRAVGGLAIGAILGVCGAAMQGLFRNPLADPGLIGVTSGASLGSVLYLKLAAGLLAGFSAAFGLFALPVCALAGGLAVTWLMHRAAVVEGRTVVGLMLLAGIAINALGGAVIGLVLFFSDDDQLRQFTFWTLGNLGHVSWPKLAAAAPLLLGALWLVMRQSRTLNALLLGETEAGHLGVDLQRAKRILIFATAAGVGAGVSVAGGLGFIGLIVPHLVRTIIGPDHRGVMPASAIFGGALLLAADTLARTLAAPAELPVGVITAAIGAPVFFSLLRNRRQAAG